MSEALVLLSERLGKVTVDERRVEADGARVASAALWTEADIADNAGGAALIIAGAVEPFTAAVLARLPELRAVVRRGVGFDNVDVDAATDLGIVVANVPDASVEEVSDHALAMLLSLERRLADIDHGVRDGRWAADPAALQATRTRSRRLCELTLGIVGLGRIGRAMARKSASVYGRVVAYDPYADDAATIPLGNLLVQADHISLHAPMSGANRYLLGRDEIASMRPGAVLVNAARGGLVDEAALMAALAAGRLGGVGLDVTEVEPLPSDSPLLGVNDRLLLTAHSAAWSEAAARNLATGSVDAVVDLLRGQRPRSVVNPDVLLSSKLRLPSLATTAA
jgi:D-3-phosphoglycerate dehydrogenase / 2-oxoglutarate reductase